MGNLLVVSGGNVWRHFTYGYGLHTGLFSIELRPRGIFAFCPEQEFFLKFA
jgi:hypothetical protein